jgi:uncharacterized membrane protein YphA (DoxX/SURF4 family)
MNETRVTAEAATESDAVGNPTCRRCYLTIAARILMGLGFTVFGLNGFLHFIPEPKTPMPEGAMAFAGALMKTGYMFQLISGTQLIAGLLLVINRFVPLALVLLMPVLVNIIAFHLFLAPSGTAPGVVLMLLELFLAWKYRAAYRPLLAPRTMPGD